MARTWRKRLVAHPSLQVVLASPPVSRRRTPEGPRRGVRLALYGAGALAACVALVVAFVLVRPLSHPSTPRTATSKSGSTVPPTTSPTPTSDAQVVSGAKCPLRGTPAPAGVVPSRPALAIKIGNDPGARPQSGLQAADIVFEVPVESGITRYIAVYQCEESSGVGPVRSGRLVDPQILEQLGPAIFGFAGGIIPDEQAISASSLFDANVAYHPGPYHRISGRTAPENLYTSTKALWALDPSRTAPQPIFEYSQAVPTGSPAAAVGVPFSFYSPVVWHWDKSLGMWVRYYDKTQATDAQGKALTSNNVLIEEVHAYDTSYVEDANGGLEVESVTVGSGPAILLRNGEAIRGTWSRSSYSEPMTLKTASGATMQLQPGRTWVEIVPSSVDVTVQP